MKTFAEMMPTATAEMREFVEAYAEACLLRKCIPGGLSFGSTLIDQMRATPPAKEPVSVDGTCAGYGLPGANGMLSVVRVLVDVLQDEGEKAGIKRGDRVRVVKIEEMK